MTIPTRMRSFVLSVYGGLDALVFHNHWPVPHMGNTDVLIKAGTCGFNNTDVITRTGWYSKTVREATTGSAYETEVGNDPTWGGAQISFPNIQGADAVAQSSRPENPRIRALLASERWLTANLRDWGDPENRDKTGYFGSELDGGFADYTTADYRIVRALTAN